MSKDEAQAYPFKEQLDMQWEKECEREHGRVLVGEHKHYCYDWDGLPIDETCKEWDSCTCFVAVRGVR